VSLQFAGNYGGPGRKLWLPNTGPYVLGQLGAAGRFWRSLQTKKTVLRAGIGVVFSTGGGVGGRGGSFNGTGQTGFKRDRDRTR